MEKEEVMIGPRKTAIYVKRLKQCQASKEIISDFLEKVSIANRYDTKDESDDLFLETCVKFNFTSPYEGDGRKRHVRPYNLPHDHSEYRSDTYSNTAFEEQAYRRGYDQGVASVLSRLRNNEDKEKIEQWSAAVHRWRRRRLFIMGAGPGCEEIIENGTDLLRRSSISPGRRFQIFKRDLYRCQICGANASDGVVLEVDHKIAFIKGGDDSDENLWTLCIECNRGKAADDL